MVNDTNKAEELNSEELGMAGKLANSYIHSPLTPMLFIAMLAMGVIGLIFTPRQEDPQISVPMVDVFLGFPGSSAYEVSSLAINPLERLMSSIPGIKHVYSASDRDQGIVTVEFEVGEKMEPSIVKVHDKIQSNLDLMPPGVMPPLVKPKGIDDVPVVTVTLWSNDMDDAMLRTLSQDVLQRLKTVKNTGLGFVSGGRSEQVKIEVYPERLSGHGVSLGQIAQILKTANAGMSAGSVESGGHLLRLQTGGFLRTVDDIKNLLVSSQDGSPVYIRDVAQVTRGPEDTSQMVTYYTGPAYEDKTITAYGSSAVTIAVSKKYGTNGVEVANAVLAELETLKGQIIPDNVHAAITRNYGFTANQKVNELIFKLFIATGAVTLLVWYFLGFRPAVVVTLVIPVVILFTVFAAMIMGYTIDRVSLFALIFSIGILVDDAIVVVENIYRRWLMAGKMGTQTAVDAVREVGNPTVLATFTVVAALLPMGFVRGMMGPYMEPIPALGSVAMIFSLFAAFVFTPWLAMRIRPTMRKLHKMEKEEEASAKRMEKIYRSVVLPMVQENSDGSFSATSKGYFFLSGLIGAFFLACLMFYTTAVTVKMLPLDNKSEFSLVLNMPDGTALPETANLASKLASGVLKYPEVRDVQVYVGTAKPFDFNGMVRHYYLRQDPWLAEVQIQLTDKADRQRSSHEIAVAARAELAPLVHQAGGKVTVVEMPPGPPVLQSVVAEVYGPDMETRRQVAKDMTGFFEDSDIMVDVDNYLRDSHKIWRFEIDMVKANRQGITVDTINQNLLIAMGGMQVGDIKEKNVLEPTYIVIQLPYVKRSQIQRLGDLPIPNPMGQSIPLSELGKFTEYDQDELIFHKDLRAVEYVVGEAAGRLGAPIYGMMDIDEKLQDYITPDGQTISGEYLGVPGSSKTSGFEWTGEWTVTFETFRDMGGAFMVALVAIYMLVVWQFGNFLVPAIIMAPIPLTLLGIIPGHWIMGAEFTATSMIGWIALAGIIVRNSILLVDFTIMEVSSGKPLLESVINSCAARTRPIIITAFALVAGSSVILTDPIFQGMAISLLFGVLISTLLTLVVIPLGCISAGRDVFDESNDSNGSGHAGHGASEEVIEDKEPSAIQTFAEHFPRMIWVLVCAMATLIFQLLKSLLAIFFKGKMFSSLRNMVLNLFPVKGKMGSDKVSNTVNPITPNKSVEPKRVVDVPTTSVVVEKQVTKKVSPQKKNVEFGQKRSKFIFSLFQSFIQLIPRVLMRSSLR